MISEQHFVGQYGINFCNKSTNTHSHFCFPFGDLFNKNGITTCISKWKKFNDSSTPTQANGEHSNSIPQHKTQKKKVDEAILLDK